MNTIIKTDHTAINCDLTGVSHVRCHIERDNTSGLSAYLGVALYSVEVYNHKLEPQCVWRMHACSWDEHDIAIDEMMSVYTAVRDHIKGNTNVIDLRSPQQERRRIDMKLRDDDIVHHDVTPIKLFVIEPVEDMRTTDVPQYMFREPGKEACYDHYHPALEPVKVMHHFIARVIRRTGPMVDDDMDLTCEQDIKGVATWSGCIEIKAEDEP